jgi:hypothetical protein
MTPAGDTGRSGRPEGDDRQAAAEAFAEHAPRPFLDRQLTPTPGGSDRPPTDPGGVRPYLLTGGRTTIRPDVNVETIVSATGNPPSARLTTSTSGCSVWLGSRRPWPSCRPTSASPSASP